MISKVIEYLWQDDFYGAGEATEIAKGSREKITSASQALKQVKRCLKK